jgi:hypothetical protein
MEPRAAQPEEERTDRDQHRPAYHHAHGGFGHWTRTLSALAPLVITELVPDDRVKQIRFIRVVSVALAAISELSYAYQVQQQRRERDEVRQERHR